MAVTLVGVITPQQAVAGFANQAVLTIGALFVAAAGLRSTGVLDWLGQRLLGGVTTEAQALRRLSITLVPCSAFLLNTPMVAMLAPVLVDWCRKRSISPSRLLIPLSYFTILGGVCTLIGTSTTLVVNGWLKQQPGENPWAANPEFVAHLEAMSLFDMGWVGVPAAIVGVAYMLLVAPRLLPDRTELIEQLGEQRREYLVEMSVLENCPLIGKTIESAGLRHLPGLFLIEIDRAGEVVTPVTPQDVIHADDRLVFTGVVTTIADLEKIPGLVPAADMTYDIAPSERQQRHLTEAVLSRTSPVIGQTVREANFRERYNAAIVAVHRNGVRLTNKIGNISLEPGDTLLLQTRNEFVDTYRHSREFYLVSRVGEESPRRNDRAGLASALFVLLIGWLSVISLIGLGPAWQGFNSTAIASIAIAGLMILFRCLPIAEARGAIDLQVLLTIAAALGLGTALEQSGAARAISDVLVNLVTTRMGVPDAWAPYVLLASIYLLAMVFTEMITNVAVAAMLLPLAVGVAWSAGLNPRPFIMAIALAASLSFVTPIGYQTNLMVMGPGGYRPRDYLRVGTPLAVLMFVTALIFIPWMWPF
jgi:di/tricarboxylate transporter